MKSLDLIYDAEMDFACLYALRRQELARAAATKAFFRALKMQRPDLAYKANSLLAVI